MQQTRIPTSILQRCVAAVTSSRCVNKCGSYLRCLQPHLLCKRCLGGCVGVLIVSKGRLRHGVQEQRCCVVALLCFGIRGARSGHGKQGPLPPPGLGWCQDKDLVSQSVANPYVSCHIARTCSLASWPSLQASTGERFRFLSLVPPLVCMDCGGIRENSSGTLPPQQRQGSREAALTGTGCCDEGKCGTRHTLHHHTTTPPHHPPTPHHTAPRTNAPHQRTLCMWMPSEMGTMTGRVPTVAPVAGVCANNGVQVMYWAATGDNSEHFKSQAGGLHITPGWRRAG